MNQLSFTAFTFAQEYVRKMKHLGNEKINEIGKYLKKVEHILKEHKL